MLGLLTGFSPKSYLYLTAAIAALGLVGYGFTLKASNARLAAEKTALQVNISQLEANIATREREIAQIKEAELVAEAWMMRFKGKADQYDIIINAIRTGNTDEILDLPLPANVVNALNSLPSVAIDRSSDQGSE